MSKSLVIHCWELLWVSCHNKHPIKSGKISLPLVKLLVSHKVHKHFHHSFEYIVLAGNSTFFGLIKVKGLFKDFSVEGPTTKRDFSEGRKSEEIYTYGFFWIFEVPILDFLQFQHDFPSFSHENGLLLGVEFLQWVVNIGAGGGGAPAPPVYMLKKALLKCQQEPHLILWSSTNCHQQGNCFVSYWITTYCRS